MWISSAARRLALFFSLLLLSACGGPQPERAAVASTASTAAPAAAETAKGTPSTLWGRNGELWTPQSRLPDFSHAGYRSGSVDIPEVPVVASVTDFGAVGDGVSDDTDAFLTAIDEVENGAIFIPPGRYRITKVLEIAKSNIVLRGAGRDATELFFPISLFDLLGKGKDGGPYGWSWGGGWIWTQGGQEEGKRLATVTAPAERGDTSLTLSSTADLEPGQMVRLVQYEIADSSLTLHLHAGYALGGRCVIEKEGSPLIDWLVEVVRVEGQTVHFDRPLRVDVRLAWRPELRSFEPKVEEVGVEHLKIAFPPTPYLGHHNEKGYNAINFFGAYNSWVQDVEIENFDNGLLFLYTRYATGRDIRLTGRGGHYGLSLVGSQDGLMTEFRMNPDHASIHDLSVANLGNGNVFSRGSGPAINFDHHRGAAYENLFSDIDVGEEVWNTDRVWACSHTPSGHYTAARETFWNIQPKLRPARFPRWPQMNIIGHLTGRRGLDEAEDKSRQAWYESIKDLVPRDLHAAQRARRLAAAEGKP